MIERILIPPIPHENSHTASTPDPLGPAYSCPCHSNISPCTDTFINNVDTAIIRKHLNTYHRGTLLSAAQLNTLASQLGIASGIKARFFLCTHCNKYFTSSHASAKNCPNHPNRAQQLNDRHLNPTNNPINTSLDFDLAAEYEQKHSDTPPPSPLAARPIHHDQPQQPPTFKYRYVIQAIPK